ncbi:hypothetical protein AtubIFM55763_007439 [Aspergillus tubingensis]|nr:uncharacterized transporter C757.13 [Aspergillus tubingensis]GFN12441.1 uncharacterized transporter C757.13 [Aspergillus tubingensis]GLA56402.1 hypothetical protein AtubIFM54640_000054 [Aspergillus tubingensis]GLA75883.1 hypothetical protein AtubIFM55763_007439 [Aspergillus tubingensis]GLA86423.1 hypothetical protein AtubIFM56815_010688 [Aspergillus tubingensis]GLB19854.1 hypothetical protein AtubIFM61612_009776 [Aspergillus tubingensis]
MDASPSSLHVTPRASVTKGRQTPSRGMTPCPDDTETAPINYRLDSTLGFIDRINTFCAGVSQLSSRWSPAGPPPAYSSPFTAHDTDGTAAIECDLSSAQVNRVLEIFWARLLPQVPIVRREDLERPPSHEDTATGSHPQPLRDAVTAYTMQYIFYSGLNARLLGLQWKQFNRSNRCSKKIGMPYFQRCLTGAMQYSTFAKPSLPILQCYCIMTLYLLDAGQHQAAYNMIGLAVRIARSLDLDCDPPPQASREQAELHSRIWWTLVHLDFRCSRHLGKPISVQLPISRSPPPCWMSNDPPRPVRFPYHNESIRLTCAALAVIESMAHHEKTRKTHDIESQANVLTDNLHHLRVWKDELRQNTWFKHLQLDVQDVPISRKYFCGPGENGGGEEYNDYMIKAPLQIQTEALLELQYHDAMISLHRVFIQFPRQPAMNRENPLAGAHAATALKHALATIQTVYSCMTAHDIFYGSCELYQYQWNAVLTLMGFMLAFPFCPRCPQARGYVDLALETFDFAGYQNDAAVRAACLTRHLCEKVDKLTMMLNINLRRGVTESTKDVPAPTKDGLTRRLNQQSESVNMDLDAGNTNIDQSFWSLPQNQTSDDLFWPWADLVDPKIWPSYCDGVNEAFTDFSHSTLFGDSAVHASQDL